MRNARRTSLRTIVGLILTGICAVRALVAIFWNIIQGNGFGMLANIVATVALVGLFITVMKYHDSEEMAQWPVIAMCLYLISNIFLIFGDSWTYVLMILPLIAMILQVTVFPRWGLLGIIAGTMMIVFNIIGGMIMFHSNALPPEAFAWSGRRISSMWLALLLVNNNSLMGAACICFFCTFLNTVLYGDSSGRKLPPQNSTGGFV